MSTAKEVKYLFIDGACLDDILTRIGKEFFNGEKIELRYERLAEFYDKVFYYDALPHQKKVNPTIPLISAYLRRKIFLMNSNYWTNFMFTKELYSKGKKN